MTKHLHFVLFVQMTLFQKSYVLFRCNSANRAVLPLERRGFLLETKQVIFVQCVSDCTTMTLIFNEQTKA